jgi:regulatory protein
MARLARAMFVCLPMKRPSGKGRPGANRSGANEPGENGPGESRPDKPKRSAYDKALGLLARREHSRRELKTKLRQGGYEGEETSAAIDRLGEQRYQDDDRFGEVLLRSRIAQGYGPMRLRMELKTHGLSDARIRELLDAAEIDWDASASAQLRRRYGSAGTVDPAERGRRAQFLLRRGFAAATVRNVTRADVDEADDDEVS